MLDRLINDTIGLLIPTVFLAFLWWDARIYEITYPDDVSHLPKWMQAWSKLSPRAKEPPGKAWRWAFVGLLLVVYTIYIVTFNVTPLLVRLCAVIIGLTVFGMCIYYCEKKMQ